MSPIYKLKLSYMLCSQDCQAGCLSLSLSILYLPDFMCVWRFAPGLKVLWTCSVNNALQTSTVSLSSAGLHQQPGENKQDWTITCSVEPSVQSQECCRSTPVLKDPPSTAGFLSCDLPQDPQYCWILFFLLYQDLL